MYIDEYSLIHGSTLDNYFLNLTREALFITIADAIFCKTFFILGTINIANSTENY